MRGRHRSLVVVAALILGLFPALAPPAFAGPASAGHLPVAAAQDGAGPIRFEFRYDGGTPEFHQAIEAAGGVWSNHLLSPVPVRVDVTFSALGAVLSDRNVAPPGGEIETVYYPPNNQLETFYVGNDGALYVVWKAQNEHWNPPVALTAAGFAPPGAAITGAYYPLGEQLELFVGGNDGAVYVIWKAGNGAWNQPVALTSAGAIPPGGKLAVVYQPLNEQLEVFFSDVNGTITGLWKAQNGNWEAFWLTDTGFAPPGAGIAAAWYPLGEQLEFFVSDVNGAIAGFWKAQNGAWNPPFWLTGAGFAPAGASLSIAYYPPNEQLELFVADVNGAIQLLWKAQNGAWNQPVAITGAGATVAGQRVDVAYYPPNNQLEVLYIGNDGSWQVVWKANNEAWNMPVGISTPWVATAGAPVAMAYYPLNEQLEAVVLGVDGDVNLAWKVQNGTWQAPARTLASASGDPIRRTDTTYAPAPLEEASRGENLNGDDADITMTINTNMDWYTGLDGRVPADRHDLVSVVMHELGHGLGFSASTCRGGGGGDCDAPGINDAALTEDGWMEVPYTTFLEDAAGTRLDSYDLSAPGGGANLLATLTSGQVFWGGPAGMAAAGGDRPVINAPATWSPGSSISHLDEATYPAPDLNELMTPQAGRGESKQQPGAIALGILMDLGWQVRTFPPPSPQPTSTWSVYQPLNEQLEVLTVDANGALTLRWKANNEFWNSPVALTGPGFAPPGAPVAVAFYPPNNQLEAFVAGSDGAVYVIWKAQNEAWNAPVALTEPGFVSPGVPLSVAYYPLNEQLELFVVDRNGAVQLLWKAQNGSWDGPVALTGNDFAPPGSSLTTVYYPPNEQLELLVVDWNGAINVIWKAQNGNWEGPVALTDPGVALFGTVLAGVYYPVNEQLEVLFVDRWGAVNVLWKEQNEAWNAPAGLTAQGAAAPGSPIATAYYPPNDQLETFFVDTSGALNVLYKVRNAAWDGPHALTAAGFATSGDWVAASYYWLGAQLEVFVADSSGQVQLVWKAFNSTWRDPTPIG